jgi:hypothetical protein
VVVVVVVVVTDPVDVVTDAVLKITSCRLARCLAPAVEPMTTTVPPACHDRDLAVHYACHVRILRESHLTGGGLRQQQRRSPIAIGR